MGNIISVLLQLKDEMNKKSNKRNKKNKQENILVNE
jgi:hypothetical protein